MHVTSKVNEYIYYICMWIYVDIYIYIYIDFEWKTLVSFYIIIFNNFIKGFPLIISDTHKFIYIYNHVSLSMYEHVYFIICAYINVLRFNWESVKVSQNSDVYSF